MDTEEYKLTTDKLRELERLLTLHINLIRLERDDGIGNPELKDAVDGMSRYIVVKLREALLSVQEELRSEQAQSS